MNFQGKVAIVTGGAEGIGKAICNSLLDIGMKVCICDVNETFANYYMEKIPEERKTDVTFIKCDVSSIDEFRAAFEKAKNTFGRIDVLVNNAGVFDEKEWRKMVDVDFIGIIQGVELAFEYMGIDKGGTGGFIINIASNAGLDPFEVGPIYSACKHGVVGLTKSYGTPLHFNKTGVKVSAVCPGPMRTKLFDTFPEFSREREAAAKLCAQVKPAEPEKVGKAVVRLLKEDKNGALLRVTGEEVRYQE